MTEDEFDKLYFKAKLAGAKHVGQLMIELVEADEEYFAFQLVRQYSPGAITAPNTMNVTKDRTCDNSPYGLCFTNTLGKNTEYMDPESLYCIWCNTIYTIDLTDPEITYIKNGKIFASDNM